MSRYSGQDKNKTIFPLPPPSSTSAYARFANPLQPYNQYNLVLSMSIGHRKEIRYPWGILQSAWRLLLIGFPKFCLFCVFLLGGGVLTTSPTMFSNNVFHICYARVVSTRVSKAICNFALVLHYYVKQRA